MSLLTRLVPRLYDLAMASVERAGLRDRRRALLAGASGRTLELGAGTGANLPHYGDAVTELVLTDPVGPMVGALEKAVLASARPASVVRASALALPFADDGFDTVVATLVLCTVPDAPAALAEIDRVLRPGGRFLFLEHVRSADARVARWQDRWNPAQNVLGGGCNCNRDTAATLAASPLDVRRLERGRLARAPAVLRPTITGVAVGRG